MEEHRETWTSYPDYGREHGVLFPRAALAPLIAHLAHQGELPFFLICFEKFRVTHISVTEEF